MIKKNKIISNISEYFYYTNVTKKHNSSLFIKYNCALCIYD
jgi:hypothetical protein